MLIYANTDHGDARVHSLDKLISFTAGRAGGRIKSGLHIDAKGRASRVWLHRPAHHGFRPAGLGRKEQPNLGPVQRDRGVTKLSTTLKRFLALCVVAAPVAASIATAGAARSAAYPWLDKPTGIEGTVRAGADAPWLSKSSSPSRKGRCSRIRAGHTLYTWPVRQLRNGPVGERKGQPSCDKTIYKVNAGLMSPYPGGFELPEVATRPSCLDQWPCGARRG